MARILLNTRASRIVVVDNILLLPAEVRKDERLGNVISPSRTLISEQGKPSPFERINECAATQAMLDAGIIEWSDEKVDEPAPPPKAVRADRSNASSPAGGFKARQERDGKDREANPDGANLSERHQNVEHHKAIVAAEAGRAAIESGTVSDADREKSARAERAAVEDDKSTLAERLARAEFDAHKTDPAAAPGPAVPAPAHAQAHHGKGGKGG